MTKAEKYWRIAKDLHFRFPQVIGALRDMIFQKKLSPELMIDYLDLWSRYIEKRLNDEEAEFGSNNIVIYVNILLLELERNGAFTRDEWVVCLSNMLEIYVDLADGDSGNAAIPPERQISEHASVPPAVSLPPPGQVEMIDGRWLSSQEIAFQKWASERFDEEAWLRKLKLRWS